MDHFGSIAPERLRLFRAVGEVPSGPPEAPPILYQFLTLAEASSQIDAVLNEGLLWLVKNKITGQRFVEWVRFDQLNSPLRAIAYLRKIIQKEKELREVFADTR